MIKITQAIIPSLLTISFLSACLDRPKLTNTGPVSDSVFEDTAFIQEIHEAYPVQGSSELSNEVRSIVVDHENSVWIATADGLYVRKDKSTIWNDAITKSDQGPSFSVALADDGAVWMSNWNAVYRVTATGTVKVEGIQSPVAVLCAAGDIIYAGGPHGLWSYRRERWQLVSKEVARSVRDIRRDDSNGLLLATDVGLYGISEKGDVRYLHDTTALISAYIRGVGMDAQHNIWAAGLGGVSILNGSLQPVRKLRPSDGIPSLEGRCIETSPDGSMWIGTDAGVVRYNRNGDHSLRFSRRWLVNDRVNDIAFDINGNAWLATHGGVSHIRSKRMTLSSKEAYFYDVLMKRHIRDPWIAGQCRLPIAGDTTQWEPEDDDNDGEYTGNYLAMESFRYAVSKSDDARMKAKKAFGFLKLLSDVTGSDGFFARTIVPSTWSFVHDGNRNYTAREKADEFVKEPRFKPVEVRWHKSKDGKWLWKGDTSSDEICGHMFGYFLYYELVADSVERKIVAAHVSRIVDHLIGHNFTLTDVDGSPTRWGMWDPQHLNKDPEWFPDRSLNSLELLSFIKLAFYVSGERKYQDIYLELIHKHKYLENMSNIPAQNPAWFIYFDVILAAYQYPILLHCEKDPEIRKFYQQHIDRWMERRTTDNNPLINFIYCYSRSRKAGLDASIAFLQDTPLDLIDWTIDHTKRADVSTSQFPVLGDLQLQTQQPPSIRSTVRWDKNPWAISGGNHQVEREPVFWLLPYWMGRYMNMISP